VGDTRYGKGKHTQYFRDHFHVRDQAGGPQMLLHAWKLSFEHPYSGQSMKVIAPLDDVWLSIINRFSWQSSLPAGLEDR